MTLTVDVPLGTTATQLQAMIDAAGAGTTFRLQAGTYSFDRTVVIDKDFVSLIGAGSDRTTIVAAASLGAEAPIRVGHALYRPVIEDRLQITAPAAAGDTAIRLEDGHGLRAGDVLRIAAANTPEFLAEIGDTEWQKTNPLRTIMVEVTEVNGNEVRFASPLTFDYDPAITTVEKRCVLQGNTLAGFTVAGAHGTPDPGDFGNTIDAGKGALTIMVGGTIDMTMTDIGIANAVSNGILVSDSLNLTLRGFAMAGAHNKGPDGNGYGLWLREVHDSRLTGLSIVDTRHAVVFSGFTTESGNTLQVTHTNRDINFHGGRDQFNLVVVDASIRSPQEQEYLSPAVFFNPGTFYGAPTDPARNTVTFRQVTATDKDDTIHSHAAGSVVFTVDGDDTVYSGAGDDLIDGGNGRDVIHASGGMDEVQGGAGEDRILFAHARDSYVLTREGDTLIVTGALGATRVTAVETLSFAGTAFSLAALLAAAETSTPSDPGSSDDTGGGTAAPWDESDATGMMVIDGAEGYQRHSAGYSFVMGEALEAARLNGTADLTAIGNALANVIGGNDGANRLEGRGGNDILRGRAGKDSLIGGDGGDQLAGGPGRDLLAGGAGADRLKGGRGADTFVFLTGFGQDHIASFTPGSDRLALGVAGITGIADLAALMTEAGRGVLIDFGNGDTLLIEDITVAQLLGDLVLL